MTTLYRCKVPFSIDVDGVPTTYRTGTLVYDDDPGFKASPGSFEEAADAVRPEVEQATAAPGEQRGEGSPTTKTAARKRA